MTATLLEMPKQPPKKPHTERVLPEAVASLSFTGDDLVDEGDAPTDFVVDRLIESTDLVLFAGREKDALKTFAALDLVIARIIGAQWLGFDVAKGDGFALFISAETSPRNMARRARGLCAARGVDFRTVAKSLVVMGEPLSLVSRETRDRKSREQGFRHYVAAQKQYDPASKKLMVGELGRVADMAASGLGRNLGALSAIEDAPARTWTIIVVDTLRSALEGDENSSEAARELMQAARELARSCGCPLILLHHTNKSGEAGDARSARGSVEITAAADVIISVDSNGAWPTAHFKMRNHEAPPPLGYALVSDGDALRIELRDANAVGARDLNVEDVFEIFRVRPDEGLTTSSVRSLLAASRGGSPGAKANAKAVERHLLSLVARKAISACRIETRGGGKSFDGWRLGPEGGTVRATKPGPTTAEMFPGNWSGKDEP